MNRKSVRSRPVVDATTDSGRDGRARRLRLRALAWYGACVGAAGVAAERREQRGALKKEPRLMFVTVRKAMLRAGVFGVLLVCGIGGASSIVTARADESSRVKRPLDLPTDGRGDAADDEDVSESILFYGAEFEGDAFFWCLDKSGSMLEDGKFETLKAECQQAIQSLSRSAEFSLVAFSTNMIVWSPTPRRATAEAKNSAIAWLTSLQAVGWTCLAPAGVTTVEIANLSSKRKRQVLVLSDGVPLCLGVDTTAECLADITAANYQQLPIHTLYIASDLQGISFMQSLAALNDGSFTIVE
ncbi:MAG: VWA domain-containing protein [Planctomycetota bacterium]